MPKYSYVASCVLFSVTAFSGLVLSSSLVSADDSVVDVINITVPAACTLEGIGMNSHNATINPGTYNSEVGTTTLKAFCNDSNGFAIYAIGYTNNIDGNNNLVSTTLTSPVNIPTGTATSGNSQWAMKLATQTSPEPAYPITIQNSFDSFHTVPDDYTLVAKRTAATYVGTNATGSILTTTYQVFISNTQPADTYTGKVKYVMVHPNTNIPNESKTTNSGKIGYFPNAGNEVTDTMGDQGVGASDTSAMLWASNFKRPGYGFAGWSDAYDYVINVGSDSNPNAHIYGPNETIEFTAGQYNSPNNGLSLYAIWVPSASSLQNWTCPDNTTMPVGTVTALTDQRDNNTYAVAKLADGKCWMIENLRLDNTNSDNATGALAQGYGTSQTYGNFIGLANPETANFTANTGEADATTANSIYYAGTQSGTATVNISQNNYAGYRMPRFRNDNTNTDSTVNPNTTVANMTGSYQNIYSYGNYYSWSAAKANTDYLSNEVGSNTVDTSICPKGWRLPQGGKKENESTNEFWSLVVTSLNNGTNPVNYSSSNSPYYRESGEVGPVSKKLRTFPNNFIYSGLVSDSSVSTRGSSGNYWSATVNNMTNSYILSLANHIVQPGTGITNKYSGNTVRCVLSPSGS